MELQNVVTSWPSDWPSEALLEMWINLQMPDYDVDGDPVIWANDIGRMKAQVLQVKAEMVALRSQVDEATVLMGKFADFHMTFKDELWYKTAPDSKPLYDCITYGDTRASAAWLEAGKGE